MGTAFTELRDEIKKSKIFGSYEASVRRGDLPSETRTALFLRPAVSATAAVTTAAVFARFVSFPLQSLNQRNK